ncbi:amino acid adenylation domain-containing protein [Actinomadura scrupuli]|uniref:amino acid adenylation domain-containing protein n=1 Tax=Actinomadura scrupuli TaxID=559629 RepID=UPI003D950C60
MNDVSRIAELLSLQMLFLDQGDHAAIRNHLKSSFARPALAQHEATVRRITLGLLDTLPAHGPVDIVTGFAGPLPILLIAERLGLSDRIGAVAAWASAYETLLGSLTTLPHVRDRAVVSTLLECLAALRAEALRRRGTRSEDLITVLANALAPLPLAGAELDSALDKVAANCLVLLGGGYQTLTQLIAMGIVLLSRHPDQLAALRAEPERIDFAVDEIMRLEGSSQYVARKAVEPVELAGRRIEPGQSVVILLGAANLDPRRYRDPDQFDITRAEGRHMGFGAGRHHCIGAVDAEQVARIAIAAFLDRYARFEVAPEPDAISWGPHANTRCPERVMIDLGAPQAASLAVPQAAPVSARGQVGQVGPDELEILRGRNDNPVSLDGERPWMQAVAGHARHSPDRVAVQAGTLQVSYAQLDRAADVLAARLQDLGVEPGVTVAIVMDRCPEALVAALAVGRAGAAFLTADTVCPPERLRTMLAEVDAGILCVQPQLAAKAGGLADGVPIVTVTLDELAAAERPAPIISGVRRGDTAYTVFTSGSTGRPKAISIDHEGLINLQVAQRQIFRLTPDDRVLQWFSPNFDGWPFDVVLALTAGVRLVLAPSAQVCVGSALHRILRDEAITVAALTPSAWRTITTGDLLKLRIAATAGEVCTAELVDRLAAPRRRVLNLYGPAEATVWSTWHECEPGEGEPPIGRPIINKQAYVLTPEGRPAGTGVVGELWIGGVGVGRYVRQIDLTRQRFRPDPLGTPPGRLMYATGDLCRWREDGSLEFVGRADRQVKIRGQRIELGEVERVLSAAPGISNASVRIEGDRLVATVVSADGAFDEKKVREHLSGKLHSGMIPAVFTLTDAPALSVTGKLLLGDADGVTVPVVHAEPPRPVQRFSRISLPVGPPASSPVVPPDPKRRTRLVWQIARLFAGCLTLPQRRVRTDSDFFLLGGDSLTFAEFLTAIEDEHLAVLEVDEVIATPTPEGIAELVLLKAGRQ